MSGAMRPTWRSRHRQREVAAPRLVDPHILQVGKCLEQVRADLVRDADRILPAINHDAAVEQPVVGGATEVLEDVAGVLDAVVGREQVSAAPPNGSVAMI